MVTLVKRPEPALNIQKVRKMTHGKRPGVMVWNSYWDEKSQLACEVMVLFCTCGERTKIQVTEDEDVISQGSQPKDLLPVCQGCGSKDFYEAGHNRLTFVMFEETETHARLLFGGYTYHVTNPANLMNLENLDQETLAKMKPVAYSSTYKIITNKSTRMTYLRDNRNGRIRNISREFMNGNLPAFYHKALRDGRFSKEIDKWHNFFLRNIPEYAKDEWGISSEQLHSKEEVRIPLLYSYPYHAHFGKAVEFQPRNQEERDRARYSSGKLDLYRIKIPSATKKFVGELEKRTEAFQYAELFGMMENKELMLNALRSLPTDQEAKNDPNRYFPGTIFPINYSGWDTQMPLLDRQSFSKPLKKRFIKRMYGNQEAFDRQMGRGGAERLLKMRDSISMFQQIEEHLKELGKEKAIEFTGKYLDPIKGGKVERVHDGLMLALRYVWDEDKPIPVKSEDRERMNLSFGHIRFRIAERTHELVRVGSRMSICVGSYGSRAANGEVLIVTAYDEEDNPLVCIEVRGESIYQVKKKFNDRLSFWKEADQDLAMAVKKWIELTGLRLQTQDFFISPEEEKKFRSKQETARIQMEQDVFIEDVTLPF